MFTVLKFGLLKGAIVPVSTKVIQRMATNPNVRKAYVEASKVHKDPTAFIAAVEHLGNEIDSEEGKDSNNVNNK
jgi:hypothetical protein